MENGWTERIEELEAEVAKLAAEWDADRRREYGYSQQTVDALTVERDKLEAENKRLREALKGLLQEAIVLTDDYLSMFETYHDTHVIQGWDKARWVRVSQAARDAREALREASHE